MLTTEPFFTTLLGVLMWLAALIGHLVVALEQNAFHVAFSPLLPIFALVTTIIAANLVTNSPLYEES